MENSHNSNQITTINIKLGMLTKSIIIILITFYLLSFLNKNFVLIYSNMPIFTIFWSELWRFLTGPFISDSLPNFFINISIISLILNYFENIEGTLKTLKSFFVHIILIQILQMAFHIVMIIAFSKDHVYLIKSLTPLNLAYLLEVIFITNKKHITTFHSVEINNRLLFVFYLVLFICFNYNSFIIETLVGLYYGFLISKYKGMITFISDETIFAIEKSDGYKAITNFDGYTTLDDALKSELCALKQHDEHEDYENNSTGASGVSGSSNGNSGFNTGFTNKGSKSSKEDNNNSNFNNI